MMPIMRYAEGHKQAVRERILRAAAAELRRRGLSGIGIPALMQQAGLTHGAFYSHFQSRDALVAEAIRAAAAASAEGPLAEERSLEQSLAFYLSPEHVAHPEQGCVIAALGGEGARQPAPVRSTVQSLAEALQVELQGDGVAVPAAAPGPTHSGLAARAGMRLGAAMDPEAFAQPILDALGYQATIVPGFLSRFLSSSLVPLPRWVRVRITARVMQGMAIR